VIKRALIFDANPRVHRIVFICVPHRGSDLAINWIGSFGTGLISLPGKLLGGAVDVVTAPLQKNLGVNTCQRASTAFPRDPLCFAGSTRCRSMRLTTQSLAIAAGAIRQTVRTVW
jgi:hypothetical protein